MSQVSAAGAMSVTHSTGNGLKPGNIKQSDSFFSKDQENVIVSKLAAKLDCQSVLERRSKEFKSINPVDGLQKGFSVLDQPEHPAQAVASALQNTAMTPLTINLKLTGDRKLIERKKQPTPQAQRNRNLAKLRQ